MDDAVQGAKASIRLLDDASHGGAIRHTRVRVPDLATQCLDSPERIDSRADGIIRWMAADPLAPGVSAGQAGTPDQHEPGCVSLGEVL